MSLTKRSRLNRALSILPAAALSLYAATPAWANMMDPELYPEAAARYGRSLALMYAGMCGCVVLLAAVSIAGAVLLIGWLGRRKRANAAPDPGGEVVPEPATSGTDEAQTADGSGDSPTDSAWD